MAGTISVTDTSEDASDLTTYTFSTQDLGAEAADRYILVGIGWRQAASADRSVSSATIGGVSASIIRGSDHVGAGGTAIIGAEVPTGTTGDVVITFNAGNSRCLIGVARCTGIDFSAAHATSGTASDDQATSGDRTAGVDLNTVTGGVTFGYMFTTLTGGPTPTLSFGGTDGLTEVTQQLGEGGNFHAMAGYAEISTGQTPRDIDAIYDVPGSETLFGHSVSVVSFSPAAAAAGNPWYAYAQQRVRTVIQGWRPPLWIPEPPKIILPGGLVHA